MSGSGEGAVLVTGATGLVGTELVDRLRRGGEVEVVGTSRLGAHGERRAVAWDMGAEAPPECLRRPWDAIVNAAANTRWTMSAAAARRANVDSVRALVPLASPRTHVIHVSTAYAVGLRGSTESSDPRDYRNTYEWSKAQAERVAARAFRRLTVVRPPLIVGRREDGVAARFAGMYTVVRGVTVGSVPAVVAEPDARLDAIPVDALADLLGRLALGREAGGSVLTIAAGAGAPRVEEALGIVVESLNRWRREQGVEPLPAPRIVSPQSWNRFFLPFAREQLTPRQLRVLELLRSFEPYLALPRPLEPTHPVDDVGPCLDSSTRYWAETNPRVAALAPRAWRGRGQSEGSPACPR